MINLQLSIDRIKLLLSDDTDASVTYAALEARLALERVCYDRLRQRHDYISHAQLRKWQPGAVVNMLIQDVDEHFTKTVTLSISKNSAVEGVEPEDTDYVEIGTEVGFDPKQIAKMWNALAKLALHVRLPTSRNDQLNQYGDKAKIRVKVDQVVAELERLATGTFTFSGIGEVVSFECSCGEKNRRRASLLREGQHVHCINPECKITWKVILENGSCRFESVTIPVNCEKCAAANHMPWRFFIDMKYDHLGAFSCQSCKHKNYVQWRLTQVRPEPTTESAQEA